MFPIDWSALGRQFLYDRKNPLLFNDGFFVWYFVVFIGLYYALRHRMIARAALLSVFSLYFFYKASGGPFVLLVLAAAVVDYGLSNGIYRQKTVRAKKSLLALSVIFNLGVLFTFKYTDFFIRLVNDAGGTNFSLLNLLLPIGISFYTFENLSYTIDVYRGEILPERRFVNYLLFLSFFPKLVMGPIVRARDFIPQLHKPYSVTPDDFARGFYLIFSGLFKKLVISDYITTNFVNYVFENPSLHTGIECLLAVYGYAVVIYCDFSGYSDVAIGMARWLGIKIPPNFLSPYQSKSITEFWRRWHISLSSWLKDYLYIFTLGGNRKGPLRTQVNLAITMILGGFWHGASWNFLLWGALHGAALAVHKGWMSLTGKRLEKVSGKRWYGALALLVTFHFVCFCWVFFKAPDWATATAMLRQIGTNFQPGVWAELYGTYWGVVWMMVLAFALHAIPDHFADRVVARLQRAPMPVYVGLFAVFVLLYAQFKSAVPIMPIYLQF